MSFRRAAAAIACVLLLGPGQVAAPQGSDLVVFQAATGLASGWTDLGWAPRELAAGVPDERASAAAAEIDHAVGRAEREQVPEHVVPNLRSQDRRRD